MSFLVGETVGSYRITEQLGSGGMATVFKAYHAALDRYVALKVLHPAFKEDPSFLARFQREARVVARLEHPNIVPVYDFNDHHGSSYLVMRYIEGETLKARLARGPLSLEETLKVIHPVGAALTYAHGQGVLHRDIKPSNIMLTPKGEVFLTDFGLARIAQAGESTLSQDSILGTPQYISPEQARGDRDLDARTDIYSLGVVAYELLVGRVPYQADTPYAVVHDHIFTPLPIPRSINPKLPEPLERFLLKTLSKNRDDRFASVEEMMSGLNRAVDAAGVKLTAAISTVITTGAPSTVVAPQATATAPKPDWTPAPTRKPISLPVWIGLGALIVVAVGIVLALSQPQQPAAAPPGVAQGDATASPASARPAAAGTPGPDTALSVPELRDKMQKLFENGNALALAGRFDEARAAFDHVVGTAEEALGKLPAPDSPLAMDFHVYAADAALAAGQPRRADAHLKWLADRQPNNAKVLTGIALSQLLQNRIDDALKSADDALKVQADYVPAHAVRGCALLRNQRPALAAAEFKQVRVDVPVPLMPWQRMVLAQIDCKLER